MVICCVIPSDTMWIYGDSMGIHSDTMWIYGDLCCFIVIYGNYYGLIAITMGFMVIRLGLRWDMGKIPQYEYIMAV
jgi:hypothetical protein